MGMQGHFGSSFPADPLAPPAGFAGHLPTRWGGVRTGRRFRADTLAPPAGFAGHLPTRWGGVRTGRRFRADTLAPPAGFAGHLPTRWGGVRTGTLAPPAGFAGHLPTRWGGVRTGRRLGELVLRRWVRLGKGSARLSLGRGTQPAGSWATICCVPGAVITPNVVAVKTFRCLEV